MPSVYEKMKAIKENIPQVDTTPACIAAWNKFVRSLSIAKESFKEYTKAVKGGEAPQDIEPYEQQRLDVFSIYEFEKALPLIISYWSTNGGLDEMIIKMKGN